MKAFVFSLPLIFIGFSSNLLAQEAPAPATPTGGGGAQLIGIVLMLGVFFLLVVWPQARKAKKHAQFLTSLQKGDSVYTQGGLFGRIHGIAEKVITLEIAPKVYVRIDRQSVAGKDPYNGSLTEGV
jgi:preprotein translocase subunit YajC